MGCGIDWAVASSAAFLASSAAILAATSASQRRSISMRRRTLKDMKLSSCPCRRSDSHAAIFVLVRSFSKTSIHSPFVISRSREGAMDEEGKCSQVQRIA